MSQAKAERPWLRAVKLGDAPAIEPASTELSDDELIEAVVQGNTKIAGQLHDRLIRVIDHTLYRVLGRREYDHDDLIQTSFEQVLRTLTGGTFAGNCSLRTWAGRITTHVALNALRSRQRERRVFHRPDASSSLESTYHAPDNAEARVELDRVRIELSKMRPARAEVFVLHDVHGYSLAEVASMMNLSLAAAQSRLVRGRSELHRRLAPATPGIPWRRS
jgi:RNA polymerase sigma-70 factor (ECF subfamily)